jgi:hypothetical protein
LSPDDEAPNESQQARDLCPRCGEVCEPYQEYCLACGERLVETGPGSLGEWLRNAIPFAGRAWTWPVLTAFGVTVLASALAILAVRNNSTSTLPALGPTAPRTITLPTRTTTPAVTAATTSSAHSRTTGAATSQPPPPPVRSTGVIAWPGPPAYTVVLASIPVSSGKTGAKEKALEAIHAGLEDVGVLRSSDFSSLHPGYYVVFSGIYKSQSAAAKHLVAARKAGFDSPYAKRVAS